MHNTKRLQAAPWRAFILAAGIAAAAGPALAQSSVDELTVYGRYGSDSNAPRLSAPVSYADLDLTTAAGRDMLRERVRLTAQDLCRRLGEGNNGGTALAPSCERDAMNNAREQENLAFASAVAAPRGYAVAPAVDPYVAPVGETADVSAVAPETYSPPATVTVETVTNGAVPDTVANRQRYGGPMSNGGRATDPAGN